MATTHLLKNLLSPGRPSLPVASLSTHQLPIGCTTTLVNDKMQTQLYRRLLGRQDVKEGKKKTKTRRQIGVTETGYRDRKISREGRTHRNRQEIGVKGRK